MKKALIVSGFPGVGKTTLFNQNRDLVLLDSDSTNFSWADVEKKIRHPDWPNNYIEHIKNNLDKADLIFVSSHDVVRRALVASGLRFSLVYPSLGMKDEYIRRYVDRGSSEGFVKLLRSNYENWIAELSSQTDCTHVVLSSGQYLADVLEKITS